MNITTWRGVVCVWSLAACAALASAQITFSRDWSGGKRAAPPAPLAADCTQFIQVCKHFIHELRQAMSSEVSGKTRKRMESPEDLLPVYDDEN